MTKQSMRGRQRSLLLSASFLAVPMIACAGAQAQEIDYDSLELLFQEPVTASATGQPQRASEAPANIIIVTADEIRRSGARNVPDVLKHVAGVDMMEWTNADADIGLRGYNRAYSARVLILVDGRQVYADHYGFMPWNVLPVELSTIRQIEIVKGPNAALFGFNAVGGVINIITRDPSKEDVDVASVSVGTQDMVQASLAHTFDLSDWLAVRVSGGAQQAAEFSTPIPATLSNFRDDRNDSSSVAVNAVARLSDRVRFRFDSSFAQAGRNEMSPSNDLAIGDYRSTSLRGTLEGDTDFGLIEATGYADTLLHETDSAYGKYHFFSRLFVGRLQDVVAIGAYHTFRGFIEGRSSSSTTSQATGGRIHADILSAGGMWNWQITPNLALTNAVRLDQLALGREGTVPAGYPFTNSDWDRTIVEPGFNSGLVWRAGERDTLRLSAARGAQLPSLAQLGAAILINPAVNFSGTPTIEPTITSDIQLDWQHALFARNVMLHANLFLQTNQEIVDLGGDAVFGPGGMYVISSNRGDSSARGLEVGLRTQNHDSWRWGVNYQYEQVTDHFRPAPVPLGLSISYEDTTPRHLVNGNIGWSDGRWEMDAFARYQSKSNGVTPYVAGIQLEPVGAFTAVDGRIGYALTDSVTLALSGQNLLTAHQRQTNGPDVERRLFVTLSGKY